MAEIDEEGKKELAFKQCNVSVDGFFRNEYKLYKNFTVFFKPTKQSFTRQDYGVIFKHFAICSAKLSLSCNDHLVKVKYSEKYKLFKNFAFSYIARIVTIIANTDSAMMVLNCVFLMIQEFRIFGDLKIRGKMEKYSFLPKNAVYENKILHCGQAVQCLSL